MSQKKIRVGVIFGGRSGEHEVSLMSATSVLNAIDKEKYEVVPIGITKSGRWLASGSATKMLTGEVPSAAQDAEAAGAGADSTGGEGSTELVPAKGSPGALVAGSLSGVLSEPLDVVFPVLHGP